jgi:hypothetical protein
MGSPGDPIHGSDEPVQGIRILEGPAWDAWIAPDGGAVKLSAWAMKMEARWLRRANPRPFGFAPGSAHPVPMRLGHAHGAGTLSSGAASLLGLRAPVHTMSVTYGDVAAALAPAAEIVTDFHRDYQDRDLAAALLRTAARWTGRPDAPEAVDADGAASSPGLMRETVDVVISGRRRPVSVLRLGEFSAFQAGEAGALVTVLARQLGAELPGLARLGLADLEPVLSELENPDPELIAAAMAERRREQIAQQRNQASPSS